MLFPFAEPLISQGLYFFIWVNYNSSQIPEKVRIVWPFRDDFPIKTIIPVRENSEVIIIYPDIYPLVL